MSLAAGVSRWEDFKRFGESAAVEGANFGRKVSESWGLAALEGRESLCARKMLLNISLGRVP